MVLRGGETLAPVLLSSPAFHPRPGPHLPLAQKEKNHILFDAALFHMRQMDFVPVTSFPQLCTKEVRVGGRRLAWAGRPLPSACKGGTVAALLCACKGGAAAALLSACFGPLSV